MKELDLSDKIATVEMTITQVWVCAIGDDSDFMFMYDVSDGRRRLSICRPLGLAIERSYTIKQLCGEEEEE